MKFQRKKFLALCSLLGVVSVPAAIGLLLHDQVSLDPPPLGSPLPAFPIRCVNGDEGSSLEFLGRKLVMIFFVPDCDHCRRELQNLDTISDEYRDELQFLAVSLRSKKETRGLVDDNVLDFPVVVSHDREVASTLGVRVVPAVYLYDEYGRLVGYRFGERPLATDAKLLEDFRSNVFSLTH